MDFKEVKRLQNICVYEDELYCSGYRYIAGLDEVGRGSLAGPLVAAAVILDRKKLIEKIDDSKKMDATTRKRVYGKIVKSCISWSIAEVSAREIDDINIANANVLAFKKAVSKLGIKPEIVLADSLEADIGVETIPLVKGESLSVSIAAASIVAKVTRDNMMIGLGESYPEYGFGYNKGYATKKHLLSLQKYGPCDIHRLSYTGVLN
ncbi:MAG: ribonuclease HII [Actinomycetota bacterium]